MSIVIERDDYRGEHIEFSFFCGLLDWCKKKKVTKFMLHLKILKKFQNVDKFYLSS